MRSVLVGVAASPAVADWGGWELRRWWGEKVSERSASASRLRVGGGERGRVLGGGGKGLRRALVWCRFVGLPEVAQGSGEPELCEGLVEDVSERRRCRVRRGGPWEVLSDELVEEVSRWWRSLARRRRSVWPWVL